MCLEPRGGITEKGKVRWTEVKGPRHRWDLRQETNKFGHSNSKIFKPTEQPTVDPERVPPIRYFERSDGSRKW